MPGEHTNSVRTRPSTNAGAVAKATIAGTNRGAVQRVAKMRRLVEVRWSLSAKSVH